MRIVWGTDSRRLKDDLRCVAVGEAECDMHVSYADEDDDMVDSRAAAPLACLYPSSVVARRPPVSIGREPRSQNGHETEADRSSFLFQNARITSVPVSTGGGNAHKKSRRLRA